MAPRPTRPKKPCKGCPEPPTSTPVAAKAAQVTIPVYKSVEEAEAARLWKWACFGIKTVIATLDGYATFGMPDAPHDPTEDIEHLRDGLDIVLQKLKARHEVPSPDTAERPAPAGQDHGDAPLAADDVDDGGRQPSDARTAPA